MARRLTTGAAWIGWFAGSWVLYLVFAGTLARPEAITGFGVAVVAASVAIRFRQGLASGPLRTTARCLWACRRVPADLWTLVVVLAHELRGRTGHGRIERRPPLGDEVAAQLEASMSPGAFAFGMEDDRLVVHRLRRTTGDGP